MPDLKPDLYSVEPDGTKTDQWIMEELLGADPVDDDYVHNIDMPVLRTDDDEALDLRADPSPILLEWDEAQHPRDSKGQFSQADLHAVSERIMKASNGSIAVLDLRPKQQAGDVELETIATAPGQGQQGAGTRAMEALTEWADQHGVRLVLSPSQKGYHPVAGGLKTTSTDRLKTFYKRFGFVEPKGRNYDPSISSPTRPVMFRPPRGKKFKSLSYREKLDMLLLGGEGSGNFGHAGRPGEVGGSAPESGAGGINKPEPTTAQNIRSQHNQRVMTAHVEKVAERLGYDPAQVDVVDIAPRVFQVGDRTLHEGGHFDPSTGRIEINVRTNRLTDMVQGLIAHEMMHAQDDTVSKGRMADHEDIRRLMDEGTRVYGEHGEVVQDRVSNDYDRLFGRNGYPKTAAIPEIEHRWPVAAAMAKTHPHGDSYLGTWGQDKDGKWAFDDAEHKHRAEQMQKDDGFTAYSKLYWDQVKQPYTAEYWRAVSETVAEVGAYQDRAPRGPWKEGVPAKSWQAYGRAIKAAYPHAAKHVAPKVMPPTEDIPPPEDER